MVTRFLNFIITFSGLSFKRPSLRSRSCCPSPSWTGTRRRCWPTRPRLPGSCAISCLTKSGSRISSGSHSTLHFLTRYFYNTIRNKYNNVQVKASLPNKFASKRDIKWGPFCIYHLKTDHLKTRHFSSIVLNAFNLSVIF